MARPRFNNLPPEKQRSILLAAAGEFARNGYQKASFNRIIQETGLSKGAMYYYFDDKMDLYKTVMIRLADRMVSEMGSFPETETPEQFREEYNEFFRELTELFVSEPMMPGLLKAFFSLSASPMLQEILEEIYRGIGDLFSGLVSEGRRVKAIRKDVPEILLIRLLLAVFQPLDEYYAMLMAQGREISPEQAGHVLTALTRQFLRPHPDEDELVIPELEDT